MNDPILPDDEHNRHLVANTHPADWPVIQPQGRYNLVVIGGGPAGLVAAFGAAGLGAKVALIEKHLLGGDCLNGGCVPSKALLRAAHALGDVRDAHRFGVTVGEVGFDFGAMMERMRRIRSEISHHDSAQRLKDAGIDVFLGPATFVGPSQVAVNGVTLSFSRCCIATGARALVPPIPGISEVGVLTNETLFQLTELPARLTIVGGGVIGCEMAQCFARFGSEVTLIDMSDRVLPREEPDASALLTEQLLADGVQLQLGAKVERFESGADGKITVISRDGQQAHITGDHILLAIGRQPNTEGMDLDKAGVTTHKRGIQVNDWLQTANPAIYACGDVASSYQFTHSADHQARIVIRNALFFGRARASALVIPWATYTQPEIAHVGMTHETFAQRDDLLEFTVGLDETDRGRTDSESGYCRVYTDAGGTIHGATIVGSHAGELLAELTLAMTHGLKLGHIQSTIHPYPTQSEVVFKVAAAWNKTRLTPTVARAIKTLLSWRR